MNLISFVVNEKRFEERKKESKKKKKVWKRTKAEVDRDIRSGNSICNFSFLLRFTLPIQKFLFYRTTRFGMEGPIGRDFRASKITDNSIASVSNKKKKNSWRAIFYSQTHGSLSLIIIIFFYREQISRLAGNASRRV